MYLNAWQIPGTSTCSACWAKHPIDLDLSCFILFEDLILMHPRITLDFHLIPQPAELVNQARVEPGRKLQRVLRLEDSNLWERFAT